MFGDLSYVYWFICMSSLQGFNDVISTKELKDFDAQEIEVS